MSEVKVVTSESKRSNISIFSQTKDGLDSIKHVGQSYDGLIQELIKFWREKEGEYWIRRRKQRQSGVRSQL